MGMIATLLLLLLLFIGVCIAVSEGDRDVCRGNSFRLLCYGGALLGTSALMFPLGYIGNFWIKYVQEPFDRLSKDTSDVRGTFADVLDKGLEKLENYLDKEFNTRFPWFS